MSFEIQIGHMTNPENKINKTFNATYTLEGTLKDDCDIINPTIRLRTGDNGDGIFVQTISKCNYMYIDKFNRYYYITGFNVVRNVILDVSGHVDVLKTYASKILANSGLVLRSQSNYNKLLDDGCFKVYNDDHIVVEKFTGSTFTDGTFILAVSGGKQS